MENPNGTSKTSFADGKKKLLILHVQIDIKIDK